MADAFQTIAPDQVAKVAAVPEGAYVLIGSDGGPLQAIPYDRLLNKLIKTDLVADSEAALALDLAYAADTVALVINDPLTLKNGWYRKLGLVGAGSWQQFEVFNKAAISDLQTRVAALEYTGLNISGISIVPAFAELGATIIAPVISITRSGRPATSQTLTWPGDNSALGPADTIKTLTGKSFTQTTDFAWTATDAAAPGGPVTDTRTARLTFLNKGHAGFIDKVDAAALSNDDVNGMGASWFASSVSRTLNLAAPADGYLWYSQPLSVPEPSGFKANGLPVAPIKATRNHLPATPNAVLTPYNYYRLSARLSADAQVTLEVLA